MCSSTRARVHVCRFSQAITARTAELESQLAASQDAHRTLTQELADAQETVRTLTEQVAAAKAAGHDTEQALVEARAAQQELTERFNQVRFCAPHGHMRVAAVRCGPCSVYSIWLCSPLHQTDAKIQS